MNITELSASVFADNVAAGWWTCLETGESLVGKRNVGELLMLCVSELCEAAEGLEDRLMDDKLPHREMVEVELADFIIRMADLIGGLSLGEAVGRVFDSSIAAAAADYNPATSPQEYLLRIIRFASDAMEHHRKGRVEMMVVPLAFALRGALALGEILQLDVEGAIAEKREFNRTRADHQVESRRAAGGKRY